MRRATGWKLHKTASQGIWGSGNSGNWNHTRDPRWILSTEVYQRTKNKAWRTFNTSMTIMQMCLSFDRCNIIFNNSDTIKPLTVANIWNKAMKQKVGTSQPIVLKAYSFHIGGVECHDWLWMYGMNLVSEGKEMVLSLIHMHYRYGIHKFLAPLQTHTWDEWIGPFQLQMHCYWTLTQTRHQQKSTWMSHTLSIYSDKSYLYPWH
jgi:hypothetical protein